MCTRRSVDAADARAAAWRRRLQIVRAEVAAADAAARGDVGLATAVALALRAEADKQVRRHPG
jgi:hypothetical protein